MLTIRAVIMTSREAVKCILYQNILIVRSILITLNTFKEHSKKAYAY